MRELTPLEQELVDCLVAFWADAANAPPREFYQKLAELGGQRRDKASVHRLLTDEVTNLRTPERAARYREQFPGEGAYRKNLVTRLIARLTLGEPPVDYQNDRRVILAELAEYWDTGIKPNDLVAHIRDYAGNQGFKDYWFRIVERIGQRGRAAYDMNILRYENSERGFLQWVVEGQATFEKDEGFTQSLAANSPEAQEAVRVKALTDFEALGKRARMSTSRNERILLSRQRVELAAIIGDVFTHHTHCWRCNALISYEVNVRCPDCRRYICGDKYCGACECTYLDT
jgi:hypothetical protein